MLLVLLDENFDATAIYEADREAVLAALAVPGSKARNETRRAADHEIQGNRQAALAGGSSHQRHHRQALNYPAELLLLRWLVFLRREFLLYDPDDHRLDLDV